MPGWDVPTAHGSLDINAGGLVMPAPWIRPVNLASLWLPSAYRGSSQQIAGVAGRRNRKRLRDEMVWDIQLRLSSSILWDDSAPDSPEECIEENLDRLIAQTEPNAGRAAILTKPSGAEFEGTIHCLLHDEEIGPNWANLSMEVVLPAGVWTPA